MADREVPEATLDPMLVIAVVILYAIMATGIVFAVLVNGLAVSG